MKHAFSIGSFLRRLPLIALLVGPAVPSTRAAETADWQVRLLGRERPVTLKEWMGNAPCAFVVVVRGDARGQAALFSRGEEEGLWPLPPPIAVPRLVAVFDAAPLPVEKLLAADWGRPTDETRAQMGALAHGTVFLLGRGGQRLAAFDPGFKGYASAVRAVFEGLASTDPTPFLGEWLGVDPWAAPAANEQLNAALLRYANDRWESRAVIADTCTWITDRAEDDEGVVEVAKFAGAIQTILPTVPGDRGALETFARQWSEQRSVARGFAMARATAALTLARLEAAHQAALKDDPGWLLVAARIALMDSRASAQVWLAKALEHPRLTPAQRDEAESLRAQTK